MKTIGIVGSGTMGSGIAEVAALAKQSVILYDVAPEVLNTALDRIKRNLNRSVEKDRITAMDATATLARITLSDDFDTLSTSDFVIEAALEDMSVKMELFRRLDAALDPTTIIASNTSSLSITSLATATTRPEKVVGMHFFNPVGLMKLVEIVAGKQTSREALVIASDLAKAMDKTPVLCSDTPGFIVNRVARPFYGEALRLLGEHVAAVEEIDAIVRDSGGFKMGPFELMDLIGIDINYSVTQSVYEQFFHEPRFRPHPIQRQMVEAGRLGRKTSQGFYSYTDKQR